ncbi:hypothetical protein [Franzmannia pantelleriensis]|uniref:hypothetical protein n=1 Tax=Franzmannia pantelleriensis TaxID=48727 RepID=UPI00116004D3|nr:hypothetical protein [Halomonas pantelleriensis]
MSAPLGTGPCIHSGASLPAFHWVGLLAYAAGSLAAYLSPLLPPLVGVLVAVLSYALLLRFGTAALPARQPE